MKGLPTMNEAQKVSKNLIVQGRSLTSVTVADCHPCSEVTLWGTVEAAEAQSHARRKNETGGLDV